MGQQEVTDDNLLPPFCQRFNRLTAGLKVRQIAAIMDADQKTVYRLRNGDQDMMTLEQGLRLARALSFSPWELLGEQPPAQATQPSSDRLERVEAGLDRLRDDFQQALAQAVKEREQMLAVVQNAASKRRPDKERAG